MRGLNSGRIRKSFKSSIHKFGILFDRAQAEGPVSRAGPPSKLCIGKGKGSKLFDSKSENENDSPEKDYDEMMIKSIRSMIGNDKKTFRMEVTPEFIMIIIFTSLEFFKRRFELEKDHVINSMILSTPTEFMHPSELGTFAGLINSKSSKEPPMASSNTPRTQWFGDEKINKGSNQKEKSTAFKSYMSGAIKKSNALRNDAQYNSGGGYDQFGNQIYDFGLDYSAIIGMGGSQLNFLKENLGDYNFLMVNPTKDEEDSVSLSSDTTKSDDLPEMVPMKLRPLRQTLSPSDAIHEDSPKKRGGGIKKAGIRGSVSRGRSREHSSLNLANLLLEFETENPSGSPIRPRRSMGSPGKSARGSPQKEVLNIALWKNDERNGGKFSKKSSDG